MRSNSESGLVRFILSIMLTAAVLLSRQQTNSEFPTYQGSRIGPMAMVDDPMALVWYGANHMISYDTRMESEFNLTSVAG